VFSLPFYNSLVDIHLLDPWAEECFSDFAVAAFICVNTSCRKIHVAALLFNKLAIAKPYYMVHSSATCSYPVGLTKKLRSSNKNSKALVKCVHVVVKSLLLLSINKFSLPTHSNIENSSLF